MNENNKIPSLALCIKLIKELMREFRAGANAKSLPNWERYSTVEMINNQLNEVYSTLKTSNFYINDNNKNKKLNLKIRYSEMRIKSNIREALNTLSKSEALISYLAVDLQLLGNRAVIVQKAIIARQTLVNWADSFLNFGMRY